MLSPLNRSNLRRKPLANNLFQSLDLFRPNPLPADSPRDRVEQLQPVFQRRLRHVLPLLRAPSTRPKNPSVAKLLDTYLHALASFVSPGPADVALGHALQQLTLDP